MAGFDRSCIVSIIVVVAIRFVQYYVSSSYLIVAKREPDQKNEFLCTFSPKYSYYRGHLENQSIFS